MAVGAVTAQSGPQEVSGGPGQSKAIVEATLYQNAKQKAINNAPLKVPDARELFRIGRRIDFIQ